MKMQAGMQKYTLELKLNKNKLKKNNNEYT